MRLLRRRLSEPLRAVVRAGARSVALLTPPCFYGWFVIKRDSCLGVTALLLDGPLYGLVGLRRGKVSPCIAGALPLSCEGQRRRAPLFLDLIQPGLVSDYIVQHFKNVCYHIRQADTLGFHAAIFFTGHYGPNWQDLKTLLALLQPHVGTRLYGLPDFEANTPGFDHDGQSGGDHAGRVETSLLWAVEPACVDISRLPPREAPGPHFAMGSNAYDANRSTGERMVADEVQWLGEKAHELLAAYEAEQPRHTLRTFEQVEQLWETLIRPELKQFRSMQELQDGQQPPKKSSVWRTNWCVPDQS
jgi:hypothetical protein